MYDATFMRVCQAVRKSAADPQDGFDVAEPLQQVQACFRADVGQHCTGSERRLGGLLLGRQTGLRLGALRRAIDFANGALAVIDRVDEGLSRLRQGLPAAQFLQHVGQRGRPKIRHADSL